MDRTGPPKNADREFDVREHIRRVEEAALRRLRRARRTPPPAPASTPPGSSGDR